VLTVAQGVAPGKPPRRGRLAARRRALGLTQEQLAELLNVERTTVARWERGQVQPQPWLWPRLAKALRVSPDRIEELLAGGVVPAAGRPDGQLYVNLRGFDPSGTPVTPAEAIRGFLDALGVPPERVPSSPQAQSGLYRSLLADQRTLIVLDNARDAQQVRPLLLPARAAWRWSPAATSWAGWPAPRAPG
jgi:transcriptional regulator with XRE-family HTH domain